MKVLRDDIEIPQGRFCELFGEQEIQDLKVGMDFRHPIYRREVFLRFYEFHLKYRAHPGAVYYMIPYLVNKYGLDKEQQYWLTYINGCTQNICTTWVIFQMFPDFKNITFDKFETWHRKYWQRLMFDIDRRYVKGKMVEQWQHYSNVLNGMTQQEFFEGYLANTGDEHENFRRVWNKVKNDFYRFGRLSTFSYLEYLRIIGLNIDCDQLFMFDLEGSKSHRNGMAKVLGRDDLEWKDGNELFSGYTNEIISWLEQEAENLLNEAKVRFKGRDFYRDVNYFTLESTFCCYKSWHRVNRRYPNVYNDMFFERIKTAESKGWEDHGINFDVFWEARRELLPKYLRLEDNPNDPTFAKGNLHPEKQNHYRITGQPIMMDKEWPCFKNDFNDKYYG